MPKTVTILVTTLLILALCSVAFAAEQCREKKECDRCARGLYGYHHGFFPTYWAGQCPGQERPPQLRTYNRNSRYPNMYRFGKSNRYWEHGPGWRGHDTYRYYRFGDRDSVPMFQPKLSSD